MKAETKVGILFVVSILLVIGFAYSLGMLNPWSSYKDLNVVYNFAGGLEVGSPVRVMGIKVGKVKAIEFQPNYKTPAGEEVKLNVKIGVSPQAWSSLHTDSRFFINLAGVIGEKFLEVTPGSSQSPLLKEGQYVRGEDPPRIDQMISQSYGLAGKLIELVEQNEGSVVKTLETLNELTVNLNSLLKTVNHTTKNKDIEKLVKNLMTLLGNSAYFSEELRGPEGQKTLTLLKELVWRLKDLDAKSIKKFLQEEGIKAKLF